MKKNTDNYHVLTLEEIASWQIPNIKNKHKIRAWQIPNIKNKHKIRAWRIPNIKNKHKIRARIPSLQRGAVWKPQQIEMLWDSILRGFPIGSIVISKKIKDQKDKKPITSAKEIDEKTTHHILDGQQRCNAIAWGFVDPWGESLSDDIVLWLDIKPEKRLEKSSRKYLFRVTTKAHPWGFKHDERSSYLSTGEIHEAMKKIKTLHEKKEIWDEKFHNNLISTENFKKPTPRLAFPYEAGFPVPVSLLIKHFDGKNLNFGELCKEPIVEVIEMLKGKLQKNDVDKEGIKKGLINITKTRLVALEVPSGTEQEVDDIEQIFQRLNGQGTQLDNEELAYSIIKAYWADVEEIISSLPNELRHSTEARLVSLGVRVALTEVKKDEDKKISAEQNPKQIRDIFKYNNTKQKDIITFFKSDLQKSLEWIDNNLLYNKGNRDYGLPKYLRSSIAWHSRDVFAWLMLLAKETFKFGDIKDEKQAKKIIGLALTIHWFGDDKSGAVNFILSEVSTVDKIDNFEISTLKDKSGKKTFIHIPLSPKDMNAALQLNEESIKKQFENWKSFWQGVVVHKQNGERFLDEEANERKNKYGLFMEKVRSEKELLIYAQRAYIESKFSDFDPSNKLMWTGFNRPWDYDHILPSDKMNGTGKGKKGENYVYADICQAWQKSIGNLTAVDFSFNRSAQDNSAKTKYGKENKENKEKLGKDFNLFIEEEKLGCFNITYTNTNNLEESKKFVCAAKERLIKIYAKWYDTLKIGMKSNE